MEITQHKTHSGLLLGLEISTVVLSFLLFFSCGILVYKMTTGKAQAVGAGTMYHEDWTATDAYYGEDAPLTAGQGIYAQQLVDYHVWYIHGFPGPGRYCAFGHYIDNGAYNNGAQGPMVAGYGAGGCTLTVTKWHIDGAITQ